MIDPVLLTIALSVGKEIAAFIQREGKDPTEEEIAGMLLKRDENLDKFNEILGE